MPEPESGVPEKAAAEPVAEPAEQEPDEEGEEDEEDEEDEETAIEAKAEVMAEAEAGEEVLLVRPKKVRNRQNFSWRQVRVQIGCMTQQDRVHNVRPAPSSDLGARAGVREGAPSTTGALCVSSL
jgi:hypothetical protein